MGKGPNWTEIEKEFLSECVASGKDPFKIAEEFHVRTKMNIKGYHKRSPAAIERRIHDMPEDEKPVDESKPFMHRRRWTQKEDERLLKMNNLGTPKSVLAYEFDRTESAIESHLQILKNKESGFELLFKQLNAFAESVIKNLISIFSFKKEGN